MQAENKVHNLYYTSLQHLITGSSLWIKVFRQGSLAQALMILHAGDINLHDIH
jgi:hypothetical protein